ncbi:MAG: cytochrome c oxidase assembly protein [Cellvibrionales bacterium]|nr:cytochrome c oxidase assembly protein [Cellvibrionales bacterium]
MPTNRPDPRIDRTVARSAVAVVAMFSFAVFAMPPLYVLFCDITGIGDKTADQYQAAPVSALDKNRTVKVQFIATNEAAMPWDFTPSVFEVEVHPGAPTRVTYQVKNPTPRDMVAQAIPAVVPAKATRYFHKTECFCFEQQPLKAGAEAQMPLVFIVDRDLPPAIHTITLSYSIFDVTDRYPQALAGLRGSAPPAPRIDSGPPTT